MDNQLRYKCIKVPLKNIIRNPSHINTIDDAVQINIFLYLFYHFLDSYR